MHFLISLIPTLLVLGVLIIIHEFGHFLACRICRVKVEKFSIGFGPEILHWQGKETRYVVSLLPLGGFVKPAGESVSDMGPGGPKPGDYLAAPLLARIFIVVSGVLMNYALAFVLFTAIFMMGRPVPGTTIGSFIKEYPAAQSALRVGDRIVKVNDQPVSTWIKLTDALQKVPEGSVDLTIERAAPGSTRAEEIVVPIVPKVEEAKDVFGKSLKLRRLGMMPSQEAAQFERFDFVHSLGEAWQTVQFLTVMTHKAIFYLILGRLSMKTISGPIGIIAMTGNAVQLGLPYLLQLTASLSISLAVINLLPIPALDGGHFFFLLIEGLMRRKVSLKVQERATQAGFVLLLVFMVFALYNDLNNIEAFSKVKALLVKH